MESVVRKVVSLEHALTRALPIMKRQAHHGSHEQDIADARDWLFLYEQAAELLIKEAGS